MGDNRGRFTKQPYESYVIGADFSGNMDVAGGEDLDLVASDTAITAADKDGDDVTTEITDQSTIAKGTGDDVGHYKVLIRAGTEAAQPYQITFRVVTTFSEKWEKDVQMKIREL